MGHRCANCWPPVVSLRSSLWLLWTALTHLDIFFLRILSFGRPHNNHGICLRYGCRIPQCKGCIVGGVRWHIRSFLLCLFTAPAEPSRFASLVVTPRGYKAGVVAHIQPTSSRTISHHSSASFPLAKKKEENREIELKKQEGVVELTGSHLSFPSVPWRS
jgi:hypothetical protein